MAGATIDCKGTDCTIDCKGNACKGLPIAVARSSTLNMIPAACDQIIVTEVEMIQIHVKKLWVFVSNYYLCKC